MIETIENLQNSELAQSFREKGFYIFKKVFDSQTCEAVAQEVEWVHQNFQELKAKTPALHKLGEWSLKNPQLVSSSICNFLFSSGFQKISRVLVGEDVDLYWATTAAKPAEKGKSFPWHQDSGYDENEVETITCWTALDFVDEDNGCLWVIPGSHRGAVKPHEFRKSNETEYAGVFVKSLDFDETQKVPLRLEPGDVVCMHSRLLHCSYSNRSLRKRRGLIVAFGPAQENHAKCIRGHEEAQKAFLRKGKPADPWIL